MKARAMVLVEPGRLELQEFEVRPPAGFIKGAVVFD